MAGSEGDAMMCVLYCLATLTALIILAAVLASIAAVVLGGGSGHRGRCGVEPR